MSSALARSRAWIGLLILIPVAIVSVLSHPYFPIDSWADFAFESLGYSLFCLGVAVRWWATLYIGGRKTHELVSMGPYSLCRNPIYWGTFLIAISAATLLESLSLLFGTVVASLIYLVTTIPVEERRLRAIHGEQFDLYCQQVPRIVPRFSHFRADPQFVLRVEGLYAELRRCLRYAWLPLLCHLVTHLRAQSWWPDWHLLP